MKTASSSEEEFCSPPAWFNRNNGRNSRGSSREFYSPQRTNSSAIYQNSGCGSKHLLCNLLGFVRFGRIGSFHGPGNNQNAGGSNTNANIAGQPSGQGGNRTGEGGVSVVEEDDRDKVDLSGGRGTHVLEGRAGSPGVRDDARLARGLSSPASLSPSLQHLLQDKSSQTRSSVTTSQCLG